MGSEFSMSYTLQVEPEFSAFAISTFIHVIDIRSSLAHFYIFGPCLSAGWPLLQQVIPYTSQWTYG
jgi:hypothetical protein